MTLSASTSSEVSESLHCAKRAHRRDCERASVGAVTLRRVVSTQTSVTGSTLSPSSAPVPLCKAPPEVLYNSDLEIRYHGQYKQMLNEVHDDDLGAAAHLHTSDRAFG